MQDKNKLALINKIRINQCYGSILTERQNCREITKKEFMNKYSFSLETFDLAVARLTEEREIEVINNVIKFLK